jgi:hypothetical protein
LIQAKHRLIGERDIRPAPLRNLKLVTRTKRIVETDGLPLDRSGAAWFDSALHRNRPRDGLAGNCGASLASEQQRYSGQQ